MDLSTKKRHIDSSSSSSPPPPLPPAKRPCFLPHQPLPRLQHGFFPPSTPTTMQKFPSTHQQPPPGEFQPDNFSTYPDMQRPIQRQSVCSSSPSSSSSSSYANNTISTTNPGTFTTNHLAYYDLAAEAMIHLENNCRDIFPAITKDEKKVKFLLRENFKNQAAEAYPFIQFKFDYSNYISYYGPYSSDTDKISNDKREKLYRLLKASKLLDERTGNENVSWTKLDDVYKKLPVSFRKKKIATNTSSAASTLAALNMNNKEKQREEHADTRLGFRFDNMFLVKRFFTFGERRVNPTEVHLVQTSEVPILYNEFKMEHVRNKRKISQFFDDNTTTTNTGDYDNVYEYKYDGLFDPTDQKYYNTYVLNPFTIYMIPPNTIYVLITMQKTLFSLNRINYHKFQKMRIDDWRWQNVNIYPPHAHKQLQIQLPPSGNPVKVCRKNMKRKKLLDCEKKWVYNDVLNPPQFFTAPKQIIVEGEEEQVSDQIIQFGNTCFYFDPNNQYYQQQQQQQQTLLMSANSEDDMNKVAPLPLPLPPPTFCSFLTQEEQEQENISMSSGESNDEMIINPPVICSYSPPQQQEQEPIYLNGCNDADDDKYNNIAIAENLSRSEQSSPVKSLNENDYFLDFEDVNYLPPLSLQNKKEYDDIMVQLNGLADEYISSPPPPASCGDSNIIESSSYCDNNSTNNLIDNVSSPPSLSFIENCNKLLEDINNFGKHCV